MKLDHVMRLGVWIERYRKFIRAGQCYRCQKNGHSQRNCHDEDECVKYGNSYRSDECQEKRKTPTICANRRTTYDVVREVHQEP